jgi:hypothetical protein
VGDDCFGKVRAEGVSEGTTEKVLHNMKETFDEASEVDGCEFDSTARWEHLR